MGHILLSIDTAYYAKVLYHALVIVYGFFEHSEEDSGRVKIFNQQYGIMNYKFVKW